MKPVDIIEKLMDPSEDHSSIIKWAWDNDLEDFFIGIDLAISPHYSFGIDKIPEIQDEEEDDIDSNFSFSDFYDLSMKLSKREIVGLEARIAIRNAAMNADVREWNLWYRRILLKNLHKYLPIQTIQNELIRLTSG